MAMYPPFNNDCGNTTRKSRIICSVEFVVGRLSPHTVIVAEIMLSSHIAFREQLTSLYRLITTSARRLTMGQGITARVNVVVVVWLAIDKCEAC